MSKLITLITGIFILSFSSFAQTTNITGVVIDQNEKRPVQNAVIALLTPEDSILYKFTRSNAEGKYILKNVKQGFGLINFT